jgi:hypothetical protein
MGDQPQLPGERGGLAWVSWGKKVQIGKQEMLLRLQTKEMSIKVLFLLRRG